MTKRHFLGGKHQKVTCSEMTPVMKTKKICFVDYCQNNSETTPQKLFISIPEDERRERWYAVINKYDVPKRSRSYCCEDHFNLKEDAENWVEFKLIGTRLRMKKHVDPHKFIHWPIPADQWSPLSQLSASARKRKLAALEPLGEKVMKKFFQDDRFASAESLFPAIEESKFVQTTFTPKARRIAIKEENEDDAFTAGESLFPPIEVSSKFVQTTIIPETRSVDINTNKVTDGHEIILFFENEDAFTTDESLSPSTEMPRFVRTKIATKTRSIAINTNKMTGGHGIIPFFKEEHEDHISSETSSERTSASTVKWVSEEAQRSKYCKVFVKIVDNNKLCLGLPKDIYFMVKSLAKSVPVKYEHILLILKKIRLDDSNARLAEDFQVSESYIGETFNKYVPVIAAHCKTLIFWPSTAEIEELLPVPFRYCRFRKIQSLIDCLEMEIQTPSDPANQAFAWSRYKSCNRVKYLISATPHGFINFVSSGFDGRASDETILDECGYFDVLPANCQIMADREFKPMIRGLGARNCEVVKPPRVEVDVKMTRRPVALRTHIERIIRRLREFRMLRSSACIRDYYLCLYDSIVVIACGIINARLSERASIKNRI